MVMYAIEVEKWNTTYGLVAPTTLVYHDTYFPCTPV